MSVLRHLIRKELYQLRRDRKMLPIVLIAPVLQLILLGYAANLDVRHVQTAVIDSDRSSLSRSLTSSFFASDYFDYAYAVDGYQEAEKLLLSGDIACVLVFDEGFARSIQNGESAQLQLLVDGGNSVVGTAVLNYANVIVQQFQREVVSAQGHAPPSSISVQAVPRVWYNPELESKNFMVPGILALLLMVITMLLSSLAIVKEKELGTMEQLNVSPLRPSQLIIGKLVPFAVIGFFDVLLVLAVARLVFAVPFEGSVALLLGMSVLFLATTLGLGLFVSTVSRNQQQAMMTSVFFVMFPMLFLSGFAFPIESMPAWIQSVSYLVPLRYFFVIIRGIFLKGAGIAELWDEALALLVFGVVILGLAVARFQKRAK